MEHQLALAVVCRVLGAPRSSIYARRIETDRLGRVFERDRLAAECVQQQDTGPAAPRR